MPHFLAKCLLQHQSNNYININLTDTDILLQSQHIIIITLNNLEATDNNSANLTESTFHFLVHLMAQTQPGQRIKLAGAEAGEAEAGETEAGKAEAGKAEAGPVK